MTKITFKDLPDTSTPLNASNLNTLQDNVEAAIPTIDNSVSTSSTNGVENQAITNYADSKISNTAGTSQTIGYSQEYQNVFNGYFNDYVKLVPVSYGSSVTLNGYGATEIQIPTPVPTITGYKCLGCVGGSGDGAVGLVVQPSAYNSNYGYNRWVFNAMNYQVTYSDVTFLLLYVRDL